VDADLELLLVSVFCTADDLLPDPRKNAQRRLSDAEVLTLCVAQVIMDLPSDRRFLRAARRQLRELFPYLPTQSALHKRRVALRDTFDWLCGVFAGRSPGASDPVVRARIGCRLLCLAACVNLNHQLGRPSRTLTPYTA
jgi:hypothetical protein